MNENEEKLPLIVECPHCHTRVIPLPNNVCPSCGEGMLPAQDIDPNRIPFAVYESEDFPPFCYSCNTHTERVIRVAADEESGFATIIFGQQSPENTTNIIVYLPECELCSESEVELIEADYEHQVMKIMVHRGFQERVLQFRETQLKAQNEDASDKL